MYVAILLLAVTPYSGQMIDSLNQGPGPLEQQCPGPNCPIVPSRDADKPWIPERKIPELPKIPKENPQPQSPKPEQPLVKDVMGRPMIPLQRSTYNVPD